MGFFEKLTRSPALKLLLLLASIYLVISYFKIADIIQIDGGPVRKATISTFDKLTGQEHKAKSEPKHGDEKAAELYDDYRFTKAIKEAEKKRSETCNYSKNENSDAKKTRLFFLKTHKTGSSTLQAIFFRKALATGKTVMLPREDGKHTFAYPTPFAGYLSDDKCYTQKKCHFLASHTVFGPKALTAFPKDETYYVSVVRGVDTGMYRSLYRYCHNGVDAFRGLDNNIEGFAKFAENPWKYYNATYETQKRKRHLLWFFGRNAVMYDLGFPEFSDSRESAESETRIKEVVKIIMERFDFMILTEKMDESLVLMADMMCWSLDDVIEFRQNIELNKDDTSIITDQMRANLREFNKADHMLYEAALARFEELKERFGAQRLKDQVELLRHKRETLIQECTVGGKPVGASQLHDPFHHILNPPGITIGGWKLNKHGEQTELCRDLVSDELTWTDKVRRYMMRKGHIYQKKPKPKSVQQQLLARAQAKIKARESKNLKGNGVRRKRDAQQPQSQINLQAIGDMKNPAKQVVRNQVKNEAMRRSQLRR